MIQLIVMTDGRYRYLRKTLESARKKLAGKITRKIIHDDSGDPRNFSLLSERYGPLGFEVFSTGRRSGFHGAVKSAWNQLDESIPWTFHLEDDFLLNERIDLGKMIDVMDANPHIVQMALRRQPWNEQERAAGGIVEMDPDAYTDCGGWLEHRKFFTTNPCLYRTSFAKQNVWPDGANSEGRFGYHLFQNDPSLRSAFWGSRNSGTKCHHIGQTRAGTGY